MSDDVREYLKAAQAAELRGDIGQAVDNLKKAATLYRQASKPARALQMLRHARRLDVNRKDVQDELARYEWVLERPRGQATPDDGTDEEDRALAALDAVGGPAAGPERKMVDRGPTRADPAIPAWCSFCCKPMKETGVLVSGPAGAFICAGCLAEGQRLLGAPGAELKSWIDGAPRPGGLGARTLSGGPAGAEARLTASVDGLGAVVRMESAGESRAVAEADAQPAVDRTRPLGEAGSVASAGARRESGRDGAPEDGRPVALAGARRASGRGESSETGRPIAVAGTQRESGREDASGGAGPEAEAGAHRESGRDESSEEGRLVASAGTRRAAGRDGAPGESRPSSSAEASAIGFVGQLEAVGVLDAAMRLDARLVLLLGPEGCGKTTYLRDLERRGLGSYVTGPGEAATAPAGQRLLVDLGARGPGAAEPEDLQWLAEWVQGQESAQVLVALRGLAPEAELALVGAGVSFPVFGTHELVSVTGGRLPSSLAALVQVTAVFRELDDGELIEVARRLTVRRAADLDLSDDALSALAGQARRSGRGGAELEALVNRIPAGSWGVGAAAPKPKRARRSKKRPEPAEP